MYVILLIHRWMYQHFVIEMYKKKIIIKIAQKLKIYMYMGL